MSLFVLIGRKGFLMERKFRDDIVHDVIPISPEPGDFPGRGVGVIHQNAQPGIGVARLTQGLVESIPNRGLGVVGPDMSFDGAGVQGQEFSRDHPVTDERTDDPETEGLKDLVVQSSQEPGEPFLRGSRLTRQEAKNLSHARVVGKLEDQVG